MRICTIDGTPIIEDGAQQQFLDDLTRGYNDIIASGGEVLLKDIYDRLGLPFPEGLRNPELDLWGWDKKGFRQLYRIETKLVKCK